MNDENGQKNAYCYNCKREIRYVLTPQDKTSPFQILAPGYCPDCGSSDIHIYPERFEDEEEN